MEDSPARELCSHGFGSATLAPSVSINLEAPRTHGLGLAWLSEALPTGDQPMWPCGVSLSTRPCPEAVRALLSHGNAETWVQGL